MAIESKNLLVAIKAYSRGNALPLDASEVHASLADANAYANSATAYPGQTIKALVDGKYKITYKPAKKLPVEEFLKPQKRFRHMFKPGNEWMIEEFQKLVDERWQELLDLEEITNRD